MTKKPQENPVIVEVDGKNYTGLYTASAGVVTVDADWGELRAHVGATPEGIARRLFLEILEGAKSRGELDETKKTTNVSVPRDSRRSFPCRKLGKLTPLKLQAGRSDLITAPSLWDTSSYVSIYLPLIVRKKGKSSTFPPRNGDLVLILCPSDCRALRGLRVPQPSICPSGRNIHPDGFQL